MDSLGEVAGATRREVWRPQPGPQTLLLTCPVPDVLFGGARGGGKSDALLGDWIRHARYSGGHGRGVIFRRTMPELEELIARAHEIYGRLGAAWAEGRKTWSFPCGSRLKMRWLDRDQDADRYQGHQYSWIGVDECGTWPSPAPIDKLRATLRSAWGVRCEIRLTANPGGVGHQWLKERYVEKSPPLTPFYDEDRRQWRVYIPSKVQDNPALLDNDPSYIDRLRASGPPWLVRAWLEGDWNASAGDSFFTEDCLLLNGRPADEPQYLDCVFAVIDTAVKTGKENDGTGVVVFGFNRFLPVPLYVLDWDYVQVEGAMLETWLPSVFERLEKWAKRCRARNGSIGAYIEDKASGMILLQQAQRRGLPAEPIDSKLTAVGKTERAQNISGYVYQGLVKFTEHAWRHTETFKFETKNHLTSQITGFRVGVRDGGMVNDDLLDCFCYGVALSLGNADGF